YGDTVTLKRHRDDEDKDEEPSAGSDRGSKRRRAGKEPELASASKEKASKTSGKSTKGESARDVYSKRIIIAVTELQIVKWHNYKHLDWIAMRRDDDKIYKFKEGDLKRLHIQDIEDMSILTDLQVTPTKHGRMTKPYSSPRFIASCFNAGYLKMEVKKGDDHIDVINHTMSFLTAVVTSWYPPTNNQLRNSSNPRQQATINNGRVTVL
nr:hypothetical protein [Tanacetum cinerariifolium]